MKKILLLLMIVSSLVMVTSCTYSGGSYSGGGGGYSDYDYDDDWGWDDDDWSDDWDDDDDWSDDWSDDWDWDDDSWDDDDDGCWDCGDDWGWFDDSQTAGQSHSTDMMGDVADNEKAKLSRASKFFANKFNLSDDQGLKIAKTLKDFSALETRNATDLAEFSQKLYGLNTEEIITSVSSAQVGNFKKLDAAVEKAAKNFNTTPANMRLIIKDLHGQALKNNGIQL